MRKQSQRKQSPSQGKTNKSTHTKTVTAAQTQNLAAALQHHLDKLPTDPLARSSGFRRRKPKKLTPALFVQASCLLVTLPSASYRCWAGLIGLLGRCTLSKQALFERMTDRAATFLQSILQTLLSSLATPKGWTVPTSLRHFGRVLLQDSTALKLSEKLARFFPGPSNQRGAQGAMLKIQSCYDLLAQNFVQFSLSSYRRNDQAASPDVLPLLRAKDLIIRDLGYFVLEVLEQIAAAKAYFLSRLRLGVSIWESDGRTPVNLLHRLRKAGCLDIQCCLGDKKVPVRLVAIRVPAAVANQRRRQARQNRDRRCPPSAQRLALMGWSIFITNVPSTLLSPQALAETYGLRWRIETIFKSWKSHFVLTKVPAGAKAQVESFIYSKLIFITLFQVCFWQRWLLQTQSEERPALSLLKVAQAVQGFLLVLVLSQLGINPALAWEQLVGAHCRYERRRRRHFMQDVQWISVPPINTKMK
jgi:hypothetical protein